MDNKEHPFFESISYYKHQSIAKQTFYGVTFFALIFIILMVKSTLILYQWRAAKSEIMPFLEQKEKFEKMILQKKELIQTLTPFYTKTKKKMRIITKLNTIDLVLQTLFATSQQIQILSCSLKKKKLIISIKSAYTAYTPWIKKVSDSKLFNSITTTHIKKQADSTTITIEGNISF